MPIAPPPNAKPLPHRSSRRALRSRKCGRSTTADATPPRAVTACLRVADRCPSCEQAPAQGRPVPSRSAPPNWSQWGVHARPNEEVSGSNRPARCDHRRVRGDDRVGRDRSPSPRRPQLVLRRPGPGGTDLVGRAIGVCLVGRRRTPSWRRALRGRTPRTCGDPDAALGDRAASPEPTPRHVPRSRVMTGQSHRRLARQR